MLLGYKRGAGYIAPAIRQFKTKESNHHELRTYTAKPCGREGRKMKIRKIVTAEHRFDDRFTNSFKGLVMDAEHLLKAARIDGSEEFNLARDKIREQLVHAKFELDRLEEDVEYQTQRAFFAARQAVRTRPYAAMGLVAGVLLIIGLMAKRR